MKGEDDEKFPVNIMVDTSIEQICRIVYVINTGSDIRSTSYVLLGRCVDRTWVRYFDTNEIKKTYLLPTGAYFESSFFCQNDTIIIECKQYKNRNYITIGEFRFKWDDNAQGFGVQ